MRLQQMRDLIAAEPLGLGRGMMYDPDTGLRCALGVLADVQQRREGIYLNMETLEVLRVVFPHPLYAWMGLLWLNDSGGPPDETPLERQARIVSAFDAAPHSMGRA